MTDSRSNTLFDSACSTGTLWLVPTPIGNLEDISIRALGILKSAQFILAEDTRRTRTLCTHFGITTPLRSFHAHSSEDKRAHWIKQLNAGVSVALVSDAGMPLISDPGQDLVSDCIKESIHVEALPGASAVITALAVSGLASGQFTFMGFLPRKGKKLRDAIADMCQAKRPSVFFEAPRRLLNTLQAIAVDENPPKQLAVCRELSKIHEEIARGNALELAEHYQLQGVRGEITVVLQPNEIDISNTFTESDIQDFIKDQLAAGLSKKDTVKTLVNRFKINRSQAYQHVHQLIT